MKSVKIVLIFSLFFLYSYKNYSQVAIGLDSANASAALEIGSFDKGLLIPRMTTLLRDNIQNPANGLIIYNIEENQIQINVGTSLNPNWVGLINNDKGSISNINSSNIKLDGDIVNKTVEINTKYWSLGEGWENPIVNGVLNKNSDGIGTATPLGNSNIISGRTYKVTITVTSQSSSYFTFSIGGSAANKTLIGPGVFIESITAINSSKLVITPTGTTGRISISSVLIEEVTPGTGNLNVDGNLDVYGKAIFRNSRVLIGADSDQGNANLVVIGGGDISNANTSIEVVASRGGGRGFMRAIGGNFVDFGTTNNVSLRFFTNNVEKFRLDRSGNFGFGTQTPKNMVDIKGGLVVGNNYAGVFTSPNNSLLVEGKIGIGTSVPNSNAILDITSTTNGVLLPRMTKLQRDNIQNPTIGLEIYQIDEIPGKRTFNGVNWIRYQELID